MKNEAFPEKAPATSQPSRGRAECDQRLGLSQLTRVFGLMLLVAAAPGARALDSLVVPNGLENTDGNRDDNFAAFYEADPSHWQQDYNANQFSAAKGPLLIKEIRFRIDADPNRGEPFDIVMPSVQINFSTTQAAPSAMSIFFAQNVGPDDKVVFPPGPLHLQSKGLGFDVVIGLVNPYIYDPNLGNLLLDIKYSGGVPMGSHLDAHRDASSNPSTKAVWTGSIDPRATFGERQGIGLVTQFGYEPVPEPNVVWLLFGSGGLFLAWKSNRPGSF